ncbi:MAG: periplasmic heavy metal sensor [Pseudomonadota bacterium]
MVTFDARMGKWLAIALFVSLGVNLFLVGLMAGRYLGPSAPPFASGPSPAGDRPWFIHRMAENLPPEHRQVFEDAMAERRRDMGAANAAMREARRRVRDALVAEPFDRAALEAALADLRNRALDSQKAVHDAIAGAAQRLPPEARRPLVEGPRGRP